ncbi:ABC transporter substrate-binding protein [Calderihabitans maritimus]|uniref:Extracellular ligand-binding receptor n=1 Tax=Calderihabitans maritimus TaxID=1246530 RepID=A0A1Z5HWL7_9FIRM|nr:ABC transporter substrate-binding protein [Calderihabitans maritimus]GAW93670.1 extracellular ligand-binding receptor [Calderihabitans maritimus]
MKFGKKLSLLLVILLIAGLVVGCTTPSGESGEKKEGTSESGEPAKETGEAAKVEEIKIGVNYELSGDVATFGKQTVNGILLAFEEINAAGGVLDGATIKPIVLDNKSDAAESTSVATKLITQEKVVVHLGAATTGDTLAAVPVATQYKVPLVTTSATNPKVTVDDNGNTREYIFRTCFIDPPQGIVGAKFAYDDLGARKAAILYDTTNDYSKGLAQVFAEEFEKLGGEVVAEEGFVKEDQDFRAVLTNFKNAGADIIYVPAYYEKVGKIISQGRELGIDAPFLGADGWDSPVLVEIAGADALNNTFFTNHYSPQDPSEKVQKFVKAYEEKYGETPSSFAALGYDAAYLIADAIERAGAADPEKIKDALAATKDFDAVTGKLTFDEQHNPVKEIAIIEMVDGKQQLRTKKMPE